MLVDGNYVTPEGGERTYQPLNEETVEKIRSLVNSAVGFDANRGDQIEVINRVFTPTPESLQWANKVLAAFAANPGAGVLNMDGKMVDIPHFKAATRILARSKAASGA